MGTLVNAYIQKGGRAVGVRAGEAYVDVGTVHGYREALNLLGNARKPRRAQQPVGAAGRHGVQQCRPAPMLPAPGDAPAARHARNFTRAEIEAACASWATGSRTSTCTACDGAGALPRRLPGHIKWKRFAHVLPQDLTASRCWTSAATPASTPSR
jgi:tRNA (mo5U34)-methyltransferase